jgi:RNA polymerase sigma-70 factor (ECF subfamily)
MAGDPQFAEFVQRIRAGDGEAARELVQRYEPVIRMEVRMRLRDPRLNRLFDSMDVCQSVFLSFFVRANSGEYDLDEPGNLIRVLVSMARNKLASQARRHRQLRRDVGRMSPDGHADINAVARGPSPYQFAAGQELVQRLREKLTDEERRLADGRAQGKSWEEIAAEVGSNAKACCKRLARALDRVSAELGLDDPD